MGFLDRLFGGGDDRAAQPVPQRAPQRQLSEDELAIERYRYLLRTAPPETIEQVHQEAFARLTPEQRAQVMRSLAEQAPPGEQPTADDPQSLARAATRQEMRQPGSMERAFSGAGRGGMGGPSFGSMLAGSMLGTIAGVVVGSAIAQAFLPDAGTDVAGDAGADAGADGGDAGGDAGSGDAGGYDGGGDAGGGWDGGGGDWGGGGGDFGGGGFGDFGGGDFGGGF